MKFWNVDPKGTESAEASDFCCCGLLQKMFHVEHFRCQGQRAQISCGYMASNESFVLIAAVSRDCEADRSQQRIQVIADALPKAIEFAALLFSQESISADKARFLDMAEGSVEECRYFLILSKDLGYGDTQKLSASRRGPWLVG